MGLELYRFLTSMTSVTSLSNIPVLSLESSLVYRRLNARNHVTSHFCVTSRTRAMGPD